MDDPKLPIFIPAIHGGRKLIFEGFVYQRQRVYKITWLCVKRTDVDFRCTARVYTKESGGSDIIVKEGTPHSYLAHWDEAKALIAHAEIMKKAAETREAPSRIIQAIKNQMDEEGKMAMKKDSTIKRQTARIRRKLTPRDPVSVAKLGSLPEEFTVDSDGDNWLLGDNKDFGGDRVLLFCPRRFLFLLSHSPFWIMDGTFKNSPKLFCQIYIIHGLVREGWFPLVMAVMERKSKKAYSYLFDLLQDKSMFTHQDKLHPMYIATDFEKTVMDLVVQHFPESKPAGCLFHLTQILYRKLQAEGLCSEYNSQAHQEIRQGFRAICGLPAVPVEDVFLGFAALLEKCCGALGPILDHLSDNYLFGKSSGNIQHLPAFPPENWNVLERVKQDFPRTTNTCEGYHRRLNTILSQKHQSLCLSGGNAVGIQASEK